MKRRITDDGIKKALLEHKTQRKAAIALGVSLRTLERRLSSLRKRGFAPESGWKDTVPAGFMVKGVSELKKDGNGGLKWVKSTQDPEYFQHILEKISSSFANEIKPTQPQPIASKVFNEDLLATYFLSDCHIGMYAFGDETRSANWDLKIAEDTICNWFQEVIAVAPSSEEAILANLGDYFHYAGMVAETPLHRNPLDSSGRFGEMVDVGIRVLRRIINMLLRKHAKLRVMLVSGNHDDPLMTVIRKTFPAFYENEPRITFDQANNNFFAYQFGDVMLSFTHGDKAQKNMDQVAVRHFSKMYGDTKYRYLYHGHFHHSYKRDVTLMTIEGLPTLAAPDAYAALHGFFGQRSSCCIIHNKFFGEIMRINPPVAIVEN